VAGRIEEVYSRNGFLPPTMRLLDLRFFTQTLSLPGWVAIVDSEGNVLAYSQGAEELGRIWKPDIPIGRAVELRELGETYTIGVFPAGIDFFVVAAVPWSQLLGPVLRFSRMWPLVLAVLGLASLAAIYALWRWLVTPLRRLESEVSVLRWGRDLPVRRDPSAVYQVQRLREVLYDLAQGAVERVQLTHRYVSDMVGVQERERTGLAREIHDGPVQDVTALVQQLRLARRKQEGPERDLHLDLAEEGATLAVRELRALCDELSPPWLELGLPQALAELTERLSRHLDMEILFEDDGIKDEGLPQTVVLSLFRVAQESIHNAWKHGNAHRVRLSLFFEGEDLVLEVTDDGTGFNPPEDLMRLRVDGHRGLANMQERLRLVGGELVIRSRPGEGAQVRASVPGESLAGQRAGDGLK
jgi:signal transduction histidine kinase